MNLFIFYSISFYNLPADRESFRKIGLTFEEKAFYDILITLRNEYNFEYGEDKSESGNLVNEKCKSLAKKLRKSLIQNRHFQIGSTTKLCVIDLSLISRSV